MSAPLKHACMHWPDYIILLYCPATGDDPLAYQILKFLLGSFESWYDVHVAYWGEVELQLYLNRTVLAWLTIHGEFLLGYTGVIAVRKWLQGSPQTYPFQEGHNGLGTVESYSNSKAMVVLSNGARRYNPYASGRNMHRFLHRYRSELVKMLIRYSSASEEARISEVPMYGAPDIYINSL
ncbi:hypothetical protein EUX98_g8468 [Antrodiella citrinella]|uniref:Uncharacterized protein n=1 Tax=Antrodiella citrinella TaxID=2447956 RepID=A0A4S4M6W1_9APHY|nr:hypothetical protein EUX98_g8468 [Antrodiella citrinella]